jgi:type IV pilus assembly protein PilZ
MVPSPEDRDGPDDPASDKRAADRAAITLKVDYKRLNTFFADYTKNISKGGTFIRTTKPLPVGTEFIFVLSLPNQVDQLRLLGEVMWVTAEDVSRTDEPAGMGIRFKFKDESEKRGVAEFVEGLMSEALGEHISQRLLAQKPASE